MNAKTISIVSYITIIGWIIAYVQHKGSEQKSKLASYHLGQGLGVIIFAVILSIVINILVRVAPALGGIFSLVGLLPLILLIFGIIAANNEALKPVPLIGKFFEGKFNF
ncbi:DUF4870 domain-containing protein [Sinomicrobium weinanense]|uniref:DUF4870 domain-containing protein n=1 Tax=Sinomicrobium weinanense TaxID=2842200 RepID=A0A926JRS8_9FLAO|nr:DUF4870 domain-containing protein [Sinomicrobium weinanense]MBC9796124.1 DUF4870 domain-containing protein [Sinomicrobium weinanense]MBU3121875.1 DUF4870 domain-containing protein [Sinomicrobium weinanense]